MQCASHSDNTSRTLTLGRTAAVGAEREIGGAAARATACSTISCMDGTGSCERRVLVV